jgi:arylsulfatase
MNCVSVILQIIPLILIGCRGPSTPKSSAVQEGEAPGNIESSDTALKNVSTRDTEAKRPETVASTYFDKIGRAALKTPLTFNRKEGASVLLIVADALNAGHLSAYGYERETSPNIDSLAGRGVTFTNYVSNSSWTRPSYTTIITGLTKAEHGVELRGGWRLETQHTTLAERFRRAGYRRAGYTGNPLVRKSWGFDQGYQVYEGPTTMGLKAFPLDQIWVNSALQWLEAVGDKPFFLSLFLTASHPPYRPPASPRTFLKQVAPGKIIEHPFKEYKKPLPKDVHDRIVAAYDDEIAYMDGQVGRLLDYLKASGRDRDTSVVFTADHGEMFGEHNCYLHAYHMWEGTLRVPLIISSPFIAEQGVIEETPFTHVDLAPTVMDLAGIAYKNDTFKGYSVVRNAGRNRYRDRVRFSQYNAHGVRREAIRKEGLKLVHHHKVASRAAKDLDELHPGVAQAAPKNLPSLAWDKERYELYDIANDPGEMKNLFGAPDRAGVVEELMRHLSRHIGGDSSDGEISPDLIDALKAVGYIASENE